MPEPASLLPLAESIADGSPVDWDAVEAHASADEQSIIRELRIVANLAQLHRSLPVDPLTAAPAPRRSGRAPAIGQWGHLALVERLGGGSAGDVYRARDPHLERDVALKLLRNGDATDGLEDSPIVREGRLLARVRHPNVITVHGVAVHDGRFGLWMDLVRGATLEQLLLKQGPFSAREASLIGVDLCRALAAMHSAGLIHRDVKAQNVMREDGGRIVLMDLGTGRELDPQRRHGLSDMAGTPLYLAPEIFNGGPAGERTDLYGLGVLLYHLVTGSFPVHAATLDELAEQHAKGAGVRLRDRRADLPAAFVRVIDRAIAKEPDQRYPSAGALEAALAEALDQSDHAPHRETGVGRTASAARITTWKGAGLLLTAVAAALALATIGWPALRGVRPPVSAPASIRSIAVLPLTNLSGDSSQEYFTDGMTDQLIGTLGRLNGVSVISYTSVMQFKGRNRPLPEIASALNVDAVLEGSVLLAPPRVRINARLIQAGTDTQLWDRTFEAVVGDVLALQSDVARAVTEGIGLRLTAQQQPRRATGQDFDTFDLYLRGRYYWNMRTPEGLQRSIQYFREAIDRDPGYALGYAGLADAYNLLAGYGAAPREEALLQGSAAATRALELDDELAEAHASLAFIRDERRDWSTAEAGFRRALDLKPGYAAAHHWYANHLAQLGRVPEALVEINRAVTLDPLSVGANGALGSILLVGRRYDDAIRQLEKTLQMDAMFSIAHMVLAEAYAQKGDYDRALAEIDLAASLPGGNTAALRGDAGYILALAGRRSDAGKVVDELIQRSLRREEGASGGVAVVYAGLGERDRAFDWLNRALLSGDPIVRDLKVDLRFDTLRSDPRFTKLLVAAGFPQ